MNAIPSDWSLALLLLFGGASTALAAWAAVLIAESWFQKMRQRREQFKAWQDGYLKMWTGSANPFSRSAATRKRLNQEVTREPAAFA